MALVNTDDGLLTQGFFKNKFWGKLLDMLSKKLNVTDNGSNLSVTPDGTSTGYDLGSSTTLKAFAQKFKNLVSALKALAFKDTVGTSDIDDDAITAAKVKDNETLPVNISGNAATATSVNNLSAVNIEAASGSTVDLNSYNTTSSALGDIGLRVFNWGASSAPYVSNSPFNAAGILYVGGYGAGFTNQWAINRTTGDIYFRYCEYNAANWTGWKKLNNMVQVGTPTNPVYIDINGAAQPCGFSVNFGTPVSGANVLNIITA